MDVVQKVSLVESRILEDVIVLTVGAGTAPDPETIVVPTAQPGGDRRSASAGNVLILAHATTRAVDAIRNIDGVPEGLFHGSPPRQRVYLSLTVLKTSNCYEFYG